MILRNHDSSFSCNGRRMKPGLPQEWFCGSPVRFGEGCGDFSGERRRADRRDEETPRRKNSDTGHPLWAEEAISCPKDKKLTS